MLLEFQGSRGYSMNFAIVSLAAAAFAMITTEFNIIGLIPIIADELQVSVSHVGLLVTAFAFTVAITGPFLTLYFSRVERRALFTNILVVSAVGNIVAAVAPNFEVLAIGRIISALALPVFWSMASSTAAQIAGEKGAGRAISIVFSGISVASVVGVPLSTMIAGTWDWRSAFYAAAALCLFMAVVLRLSFPRMPPDENAPESSFLALLRQPIFIAHLLLSLLVLTSLFTSYTYLADTLSRIAGLSDHWVGWALMGFGVVGIVGNSIAGRNLDSGPMKVSIVALLMAGVSMAISVPSLANSGFAILVFGLWGAAHAASFVANHVRVMTAAPKGSEALAASLNVSVFNTGIGLGAFVGGRVIDVEGLGSIGPVSAVIATLALALGLAITYMRRRSSALKLQNHLID